MFFHLLLNVIPLIFQVSWVRRKGDELNLITFGRHTYSSDSRYSLEYVAPNDWQLLIQYANERDEGHYECQISSHPPLVLLVYLTVVGKCSNIYNFSYGNVLLEEISLLVNKFIGKRWFSHFVWHQNIFCG